MHSPTYTHHVSLPFSRKPAPTISKARKLISAPLSAVEVSRGVKCVDIQQEQDDEEEEKIEDTLHSLLNCDDEMSQRGQHLK